MSNKWLDSTVKAYERFYGITDKPVVWEVGSRDGRDGVELAQRIYKGQEMWFWSNATVVCMEPNPDQAAVIRRDFPEVTTIELAASNAVGEAPFMVYHGDAGAVGSSSLNLSWKKGDLEGHKIVVETERLDNLIGDVPIDIMKIDVEGHSMAVMDGLGAKIRQVRVYHIETEKWTDSNIQMKVLMTSHGYTLVDESEQYGGMPDLVFVRV